jgi:membrane protease subunit HflK
VEEVLSRANKVLIDTADSNNLVYLPLDKILEGRSALQGATGSGSARSVTPPGDTQEIEATTTRSREELRNRGGR